MSEINGANNYCILKTDEEFLVGHSCKNSNECKDNGLMNAKCTKKRCICKLKTQMTEDSKSCVSEILGASCTNDVWCQEKREYATCQGFVCTCSPGMMPSEDDKCVKRIVGTECNTDQECTSYDLHSHCSMDQFTCKCNPGRVNRNQQCISLILGDPCIENEDCTITINGAICVQQTQIYSESKICVCVPGKSPTPDRTSCQTITLGSMCTTSEHCLEVIDNSVCKINKRTFRGVCVCDDTSIKTNNDLCMKNVTFVQRCKNDSTCIKNFAFNSNCEGDTCKCKSGNVFDFENMACIRRSFNSDCSNDEECEQVLQNTHCNVYGKCKCRWPYIRHQQTCILLVESVERYEACLNGGDLFIGVDNQDIWRCHCPIPYSGILCDLRNVAFKKEIIPLNKVNTQTIVDGDYNNLKTKTTNEFCYTTEDNIPYITIDLGSVKKISTITVLLARCTECKKDDILLTAVILPRDTFNYNGRYITSCEEVERQLTSFVDVEPLILNCLQTRRGRHTNLISGQFVTIVSTKNQKKHLSICEVEVHEFLTSGLIGGSCDQRQPCFIVNSECNKGMCRCMIGYVTINNWNNFCDIAPPTTAPTTTLKITCATDHSICDEFVNTRCEMDDCICKDFYNLNQYNICAPLLIEEQGCQYRSNCSELWENSDCGDDELCRCQRSLDKGGYILSTNGNRCIKAELGLPCTYDDECKNIFSHSLCKNNKCVCSNGTFPPHDNSYCVYNKIGDFCFNSTECATTEFSLCNDNVCECFAFFEANATNSKCIFFLLNKILSRSAMIFLLCGLIYGLIIWHRKTEVLNPIENINMSDLKIILPRKGTKNNNKREIADNKSYWQRIKDFFNNNKEELMQDIYIESDDPLISTVANARKWGNKKENLLKDIPDMQYLMPNEDYGAREYINKETDIAKDDYNQVVSTKVLDDVYNPKVISDSPLDQLFMGFGNLFMK